MENVIDFVNDVYDWSIERILTTPEILEHPESLKMLVAYRG